MDTLPTTDWRGVPGGVVSLYRKVAAAAFEVAASSDPGPVYWHPGTGVTRNSPAAGSLLVKGASDNPIRDSADVLAGVQRPFGGPNPLTASVVGGLLGSGLGYGGGWLAEQVLPEDHFDNDKHRLRRTLAVIGGMAGAAPGVAWGAVNHANPKHTGGGLKSLVSPWGIEDLPKKASWLDPYDGFGDDLPDWFRKSADAGGLYTPTIPVDAFNRVIWSDVAQPQNPFGTKSMWGDNSQPLQTPPWAAAAASGIVSGAGAATDHTHVSPWQVGLTAATAAGTGYAAGMLFGKTLGALAGLRPEAQQAIKDTGLWGGLVAGAVSSLYGNR